MEYGELTSKKTLSLCELPGSSNSFLNVREIDLSKGSIRLNIEANIL